jgi:hypothetical protein
MVDAALMWDEEPTSVIEFSIMKTEYTRAGGKSS